MVMLAAAGVSPSLAQDATWVLNPVTLGGQADFLNSANWSTAQVPTGTATFGASNTTSVIFATPTTTTLNSFNYAAGAPSYSFSLTAGSLVFLQAQQLQLSTSPNTMTVGNGQLTFKNNSDVPFTFLVTNSGAQVVFQDNSTVGAADLIGNAGSTITFRDSASAASNIRMNDSSVLNFQNTSTAGTATIDTNSGGTVRFLDTSTAGTAVIHNSGANNIVSTVLFQNSSTAGNATITTNASATTSFQDTSTAGTAQITTSNGGSTFFRGSSSAASATLVTNGTGVLTFSDLSTAGNSAITNNSGGTTIFTGNSTAAQATITNNGASSGFNTVFKDTSTAGAATIINNFGGPTLFQDSSTAGTATISGSGVSFVNASNAASATINTSFLDFEDTATAGSATITIGTLARFFGGSSGGQARFIGTPGGTFDISGLTSSGMTAGSIEGPGSYILDSKLLSVGGNNLSTEVSGTISGVGGSLAKEGSGTLILSGNNTYTGGTTIDAGILQLGNGGTSGSIVGDIVVRPLGRPQGSLVVNRSDTLILGGTISGTGDLQQAGPGTTILTGNNTYSGGTTIIAGTLQLGNGGATGSISPLHGAGGIVDNSVLAINRSDTLTLETAISGTGSLRQIGTGTTILTAENSYSGPTGVLAGRLAVNGTITSNVTVASQGNLGGSGTIFGTVLNNGIISPGNSIGTLAIVGSYTQTPGSFFQVEVNAGGQSDLIRVTGQPGTATILGGTVNVLAAPGAYAKRTTYTIVNASGGVTGTYAGLTTNFAFLQPSLTYDPNNVFLTLDLLATAFGDGGRTPNQKSVGRALDQSFLSANGDLAGVLSTLAGLTATDGPAALDALGGEIHSGLASIAVLTSRLFMNEVGRQMASARAGNSAPGSRIALADACSVCAADPARWTAWASGLGATGALEGDGNAHTLSFTVGGFAAGVERRFDERFSAGLALGYTNGTRFLGGLEGSGTTDTYNAALYASFASGGFYFDELAGYGFLEDRVTRGISFPGLARRTATGQRHADQFLAQIEAGYRFSLERAQRSSITPFLRLQASSTGQAGLTESGANALDLTVASSVNNSLRSTLGAEFAGQFDMGWREAPGLRLRIGWAHEYANDSHPVTASFAGAPGALFTVFGAVPQRDSALVSLEAATAIATATNLYLRYDGDISSFDQSHAATLGLRLTW